MNLKGKNIILTVDVLGRVLDPEKVIENTILFYVFSDGSVEKIIKSK